jgi:hypothetical protein
MAEDGEGNSCGANEVMKNTTQNISGWSVSREIFEMEKSPKMSRFQSYWKEITPI